MNRMINPNKPIRYSVFPVLGLLFLALLLAACTPDPVPAAVPASPTEPQSVMTEASPQQTNNPAATETGATVDDDGGVSFSNDVLPILQNNCIRCHGDSRTYAGLRLNSFAGILAGSENGPVILPGDAPNSRLIQLITAGEMPRQGSPLADEEIRLISNWISQGAVDD